MQALVVERAHELSLRDAEIDEALGPRDVRICPVSKRVTSELGMASMREPV